MKKSKQYRGCAAMLCVEEFFCIKVQKSLDREKTKAKASNKRKRIALN